MEDRVERGEMQGDWARLGDWRMKPLLSEKRQGGNEDQLQLDGWMHDGETEKTDGKMQRGMYC